jgi:hypothetical protein
VNAFHDGSIDTIYLVLYILMMVKVGKFRPV